VVRRADAPEGRLAPEDRLAPVDRLFPADRLPPDDRLAAAEPLDPEDRLAPEDRVAPDDPLPPEDPPPFDAPLPPAAFLERVDLFAVEPAVRLALARDAVAGLDEPEPPLLALDERELPRLALDEPEPPLLALVPGVVRPVCFRAFLVVATSSPFQDHSGATPWSRTDNRCKANPASASRGSHKSRLSSDPGGEVHLRRVAPAGAQKRRADRLLASITPGADDGGDDRFGGEGRTR
jgi:hypothetical protein